MMNESIDITRLLRCPHCLADIGKEELNAPHPCLGRPILQRGAIYDFARVEFYWNHLPAGEMSDLCATARKSGWRTSLLNHLKPRVSDYTYRYAIDERRADWFPLCSLTENSIVVDTGAGWGAISMGLARLGGQVLSLDSTIETLEFVSIRAEQEGLRNVHCIRIDPLELSPLPLNDAIADLIVLNGVLEWVGTATEEGDPRELQRNVLRVAHRALKPGGQLYLAIESRYGHSYWRGAVDHPQTRFTSLMPRWLASTYTKWRGLGPYRTYTHSYRGLQSLLHEAGFGDATFYAPFPEYRFPHRLVPIDNPRAFVRTVRHVGLSRKHMALLTVLGMLGVQRSLVDDYSVVATK